MKERPILYSAPMVQATADDRKTQTRRVVKPQPVGYPPFYLIETPSGYGMFAASGKHRGCGMGQYDPDEGSFLLYDGFPKHGGLAWQRGGRTCWRCPYGKPGDRLYVKEEHMLKRLGEFVVCYYRSSVDGDLAERGFRWDTIPEGSRQRLAKIKTWGKWRPGRFMYRFLARLWLEITGVRVDEVMSICDNDARAEGFGSIDEFRQCWNALNAKRGFQWENEPWVWIVEFRKT